MKIHPTAVLRRRWHILSRGWGWLGGVQWCTPFYHPQWNRNLSLSILLPNKLTFELTFMDWGSHLKISNVHWGSSLPSPPSLDPKTHVCYPTTDVERKCYTVVIDKPFCNVLVIFLAKVINGFNGCQVCVRFVLLWPKAVYKQTLLHHFMPSTFKSNCYSCENQNCDTLFTRG